MERDYRLAYQSTTFATPSGPTDAENRLPRGLLMAVAVLGLASCAFSFGPVEDGAGATDWSVRFAVLAALAAALSVLPKQKPQTFVTAVLAATGFVDALSSVLTTEAGWPLTVIVVLNAAQTAAAIAALVLWPKEYEDNSATAGYEAYVDYYNQAVRQYYGQQAASSSAPPESSQHGGYGQASSGAQAARSGQRVQRPTQYGDYSDLVSPQTEYGRPAATANSPAGPDQSPHPGIPDSRPAQTPPGKAQADPDESHPSSWLP